MRGVFCYERDTELRGTENLRDRELRDRECLRDREYLNCLKKVLRNLEKTLCQEEKLRFYKLMRFY